MHYTKPMIELVMEVRRRTPAELKPSIKLANPELLTELLKHYLDSSDTITRTLIKELMKLAGEPWVSQLKNPDSSAVSNLQTKVYRGQTSLEQSPTKSAPEPAAKRPVKVYRGQVVYT
ncbi:hypothetical protein [Gilvimarinus polysaccharolyticus]|uniref:hypothetical protein n=1 Tax=Gilvimarinus polysaccharolyticus TaxID=863921 RepID=UPI0006738D71|nr:hypothetical protein [Gilvimarinus polysaccharolyticus]